MQTGLSNEYSHEDDSHRQVRPGEVLVSPLDNETVEVVLNDDKVRLVVGNVFTDLSYGDAMQVSNALRTFANKAIKGNVTSLPYAA